MRRFLLVIGLTLFASSSTQVASAQQQTTYEITNVIPANETPIKEVDVYYDPVINKWVILIAATCQGSGPMATVNSGYATSTGGTPSTSFEHTSPTNHTGGNLNGTLQFNSQPASGTQVTLTFIFSVQGNPGTKSASTTFKIK